MKSTFKSISLIAAFVAFAGLAPVSASANCCEHCMGQEQNHHFGMMETKLGLSTQQKQDIKNVFAKSRTQREPLMQQMEKEKKALRALMCGDAVNDAAIRAQSSKIAAVEADLAILHAHTMQQVRALLTPEQTQKLKDIREKHRHRAEHRHHRSENHCKQDN